MNHHTRPSPNSTHTSERSSRSIKDVFKESWISSITGFLIILVAVVTLFWNEGRAVQSTQMLEEVKNLVVPVKNPFYILEENNGKLVHTNSFIYVGEPLTEMEYGISVPSVKLKRRVQMYQWVEGQMESSANIEPDHPAILESEIHAEMRHYYYAEWKDKLIDSSLFNKQTGHHNPKLVTNEFPLKSTVYVNEIVNIGKYFFGPDLKEKFVDFIQVTSDERPERRDIKLHSGLYYHSHDVWNPEIGDVRVQFSYAGKAGERVTVVAKQIRNELVPYETTQGAILILRHGDHSIEEIFLEEQTQNTFLSWALRGVGWLLLFVGINCISSILNILVYRYQILRGILLITGCITMVLALFVSLLVIGFAWVWYRPLVVFCCMLAVSTPFLYASIREYWSGNEENRYHRL